MPRNPRGSDKALNEFTFPYSLLEARQRPEEHTDPKATQTSDPQEAVSDAR